MPLFQSTFLGCFGGSRKARTDIVAFRLRNKIVSRLCGNEDC